MIEHVPDERRAEWRAWVEQHVGGDNAVIDSATDAALHVLLAGGTVDEAAAAAQATGRWHRSFDGSARLGRYGHPVSDHDHIRGVVTSFRSRNEMVGPQSGSVWSFRVDAWDESGQPQPPVTVEMRGTRFEGSIAEGDWVELAGRAPSGVVVHPRTIRNLTMNCVVTARRPLQPIRALLGVVFFVIIVGVIAAALIVVFSNR